MNFGSIQRLLLKPLVPVIRINGFIDAAQTAFISKSLEQVNKNRSKALVIIINSKGGLPVQSELIIEKLRYFCDEHHLKLYTFAENAALSTGYNILASGDKVYADSTSLVGNVGTSAEWLGVNRFLQRYKLKFSPLQDEIKDSDKAMLKGIVNEVDEELYKQVEKYRGNKLAKDPNMNEKEIFRSLWTGTKAMKLGLVDHLGTYDAVIAKEFPNARLVNLTVKNRYEKYYQRVKFTIILLTSNAIFYFIAYWVIKLAIKIYLIILVLRKGKDKDKDGADAEGKKKGN